MANQDKHPRTDSSDRRVAPDDLQIETIAENLPGNLVRRVLHPDGRFTYAFLSEGLRDMFGIDPDAILDQETVDFSWVHHDDRAHFKAELMRSAADLTPLDMENRVIGSDRNIRWVRSIAHPRRMDDGRVVWDGVALDVTDKKHAEEEMAAALRRAEAADQAKTKFLAAASHDIRQPLQAMRFNLATLIDAEQEATRDGALQRLDQCITGMEALINSLLDISKLDAGIISPKPTSIRIDRIVEDVLIELLPTLQTTKVEQRISADACWVWSDPDLIVTIIRNLAHNAVKFAEPQSGRPARTVFRVIRHSRSTWISFANSGGGIATDDQARIFEPFVQIGNHARDRSKGLGLGLAIVERAAHLLGVPLRLRSIPGVGVVFAVALPTTDVPPVVGETIQNYSPPAQSFEDFSAWILEDDQDVALSLETLMRGWGIASKRVTRAAELDALARQAKQPPSVIIADFLTNSQRTGVQALKDAQRLLADDVPGIILTGETNSDHLRTATDSGFDVLNKPVAPGKLRALLRYYAEHGDDQ